MTIDETTGRQTEAWLVEWTEIEVGWGERPDGAWYYATEKAALDDTERMLAEMRKREEEIESGRTSPQKLALEFSRPELPPRLVAVSAELAREVTEKGRAFRERVEAGGALGADWPGVDYEP